MLRLTQKCILTTDYLKIGLDMQKFLQKVDFQQQAEVQDLLEDCNLRRLLSGISVLNNPPKNIKSIIILQSKSGRKLENITVEQSSN